MQRLLKQTTTGHIFVWTENLASRPDMEEYVRLPPAPVVAENPRENPDNASAEKPPSEIELAKAAFRRQVRKGPRKPAQVSGAP